MEMGSDAVRAKTSNLESEHSHASVSHEWSDWTELHMQQYDLKL